MLDLNELKKSFAGRAFAESFGEVQEISEQMAVSKGPVCRIGDTCAVGEDKHPYEVVSLKAGRVYLLPLYHSAGVKLKDRVTLLQQAVELPAASYLLGRVLNGQGELIDGGAPVAAPKRLTNLDRDPPKAMDREFIANAMPTGIKAIDAFATIGEGQRIGIFAGTGVGKSTLLGMIAKYAKADVNVVAFVGERGREVREFLRDELGEEGLAKSVVVVSTSDDAPLMKIKAAKLATSIAEEFRDQGKKVMLMMDSVTRFAMAKRDIDYMTGSIGEKTPSMEPSIQRLLERAGMSDRGSITGIYTVLVEGDDLQGAIPDIARGTLDGHIELDRKIAAMGHYPAINIGGSISRVMDQVVSKDHLKLANLFKKYLEIYRQNEDIFAVGAYVKGRDADVDIAKALYPRITEFLKQDIDQAFDFEQTMSLLKGMAD